MKISRKVFGLPGEGGSRLPGLRNPSQEQMIRLPGCNGETGFLSPENGGEAEQKQGPLFCMRNRSGRPAGNPAALIVIDVKGGLHARYL